MTRVKGKTSNNSEKENLFLSEEALEKRDAVTTGGHGSFFLRQAAIPQGQRQGRATGSILLAPSAYKEQLYTVGLFLTPF